MNPLELEIYHQIKNVIGVNPSFYEYLFMVDADTVVDTLSVNRLVSAYVHTMLLCVLFANFISHIAWCMIRKCSVSAVRQGCQMQSNRSLP